MVFNDFRSRVTIRIILLGVTMFGFVYLFQQSDKIVTAAVLWLVIIGQMIDLFRFVENTNRKLQRFLESVRYSDFISNFSADNNLGTSFRDLNHAFNEVLEAFRETRSDKEEHLLYLNTVVQHVSTGLLSFDEDGNVGLINSTAKKFLNAPQLRNIKEFTKLNEDLYALLKEIRPGQQRLFRCSNRVQLAMHATEIRLRGSNYKLVALQNIQEELQTKEIEAWQNLTRVLRHEIMNSITPIASLTSTLKDILNEDVQPQNGHFVMEEESVEDLNEGLATIENRSHGLIGFVDAYRSYTSIPRPQFTLVPVKQLLADIEKLMKVEIQKSNVQYVCEVHPETLQITADEEQIEQVLINLVKNALESLQDEESPILKVMASQDMHSNVHIRIMDNGPGIIPEALDKIFIPFYTTKKTGSGIGLSLSRQIMQLHNGSLSVESEPHVQTEFTLKF